jgi:chemotaxis receptor (MCP) glutamine deamidase CheD
MLQPPKEFFIEPDAFRVASEPVLLVADLRAALAVCLHDDTQGVGGLLHLRYVATDNDGSVDLTDNTLSSDLLLMDRFCKELRSAGARKQSWRVRIYAHLPESPNMEKPAATVLDLLRAYFADSRLPTECKEICKPIGVRVRLHAREGHVWVNGEGCAESAARTLKQTQSC